MNFRLLCVLLLAIESAGKGKSLDRIRREECEKLEVCKYDLSDNCVFRCMSEKCYEKIYGNFQLEPDEVRRDESKMFNECFRDEDREKKENKANSY